MRVLYMEFKAPCLKLSISFQLNSVTSQQKDNCFMIHDFVWSLQEHNVGEHSNQKKNTLGSKTWSYT